MFHYVKFPTKETVVDWWVEHLLHLDSECRDYDEAVLTRWATGKADQIIRYCKQASAGFLLCLVICYYLCFPAVLVDCARSPATVLIPGPEIFFPVARLLANYQCTGGNFLVANFFFQLIVGKQRGRP